MGFSLRIAGFMKDGSIMSKAKIGNQIIFGDRFSEQLIQHYRKTHNAAQPVPGFHTYFPFQSIPQQKIIEAANKVKKNKAISWDCIDGYLFTFDKKCKAPDKMCSQCQHKLKILKKVCSKSYWQDSRSAIHFKARLIPLNKTHPKIPSIEEYRPIIVVSYVFKFLEQLIMPSLQLYQTNQLDKRQFGFVKGVSIAQSKRYLCITVMKLLVRGNVHVRFKEKPIQISKLKHSSKQISINLFIKVVRRCLGDKWGTSMAVRNMHIWKSV